MRRSWVAKLLRKGHCFDIQIDAVNMHIPWLTNIRKQPRLAASWKGAPSTAHGHRRIRLTGCIVAGRYALQLRKQGNIAPQIPGV